MASEGQTLYFSKCYQWHIFPPGKRQHLCNYMFPVINKKHSVKAKAILLNLTLQTPKLHKVLYNCFHRLCSTDVTRKLTHV